MSSSVITEKDMAEYERTERNILPSSYGCEILLEKTTLDKIKDPSFPLDAYIVIYRINNETFMDLCRGSRIKIFDMYYDRFGPDSVKKIDWGYGKVNPKLWGIKKQEKKKRQ